MTASRSNFMTLASAKVRPVSVVIVKPSASAEADIAAMAIPGRIAFMTSNFGRIFSRRQSTKRVPEIKLRSGRINRRPPPPENHLGGASTVLLAGRPALSAENWLFNESHGFLVANLTFDHFEQRDIGKTHPWLDF